MLCSHGPRYSQLLALIVAAAFINACNDNQVNDNQRIDETSNQSTSLKQDESSRIIKQSSLYPESSNPWPSARFATAGRIESMPQRTGDPVIGRQALLEEAYVNCGIPESAFRELVSGATIVQAPDRTPEADGLPYSSNVFENEAGVRVVSSNCLACHGTSLFGELVIGLGNEFLDFTVNQSVLAERAGTLVTGVGEIEAWELYANRISAIAPFIQTHTIGVNPANNLTFALIAHREAESNAWSESPLLPLPPVDPPPVSVPPWWRMAKKPAMFNMGEGRSDHARIMMAASMMCSDSLNELEAIDAYAPDIRAYIASIEPPEYPFDINVPRALEGKVVFEKNCSACHGTYANSQRLPPKPDALATKDTYPARLIPIEVIQTDDTLVRFAHDEGAAYSDWFNRSYYGQLSVAAPGPGYVAPPLDGIWATSPFLHNGSIPTIRQLLDSSQRIRYWKHIAEDASSERNYDQENLGWRHDVLTEGKPAGGDKSIYDTDLPGYANTGHRFGDHLTDEQRSAVIEYLKTL